MKFLNTYTVVLFLLLRFTAVTFAEEKVRVWTDTEGRQISATLLGLGNDHLSIRLLRCDGQEFTLPINRFCLADKEYISKNSDYYEKVKAATARLREEQAESIRQNAEIEKCKAEIAKQQKTLSGKVLQLTSEGVLIRCVQPRPIIHSRMERLGGFSNNARPNYERGDPDAPFIWGTFLLLGCTNETQLVDGSPIDVRAYPAGRYSYNAADGTTRTVERFAVSLIHAATISIKQKMAKPEK